MLKRVDADSLSEFGASPLHALIEEKAGAGTWLQDLDGTDGTMWSRGMYTLLGLEPGVPPDWRTVEALIHPDDRERVRQESVERLLRDQVPTEQEFRVLRPNGTIRWLTSRREVLFGEDGKPCCLIGVLVDNTARVDAVRRHESLEEHRRKLAKVVSCISWVLGVDGERPDVPLWRELTGQSIVEAAGSGWLNAAHPEDRGELGAGLEQALAARRPHMARFRLRDAAGTYRAFVLRTVPIFDEAGGVREWICLCLDVDSLDTGAGEATGSPEVLSGAQLRAARGALNWSVQDLSLRTGLTAGVIRRIEANGSTPLSDPALARALLAFQDAGLGFARHGADRVSLTIPDGPTSGAGD